MRNLVRYRGRADSGMPASWCRPADQRLPIIVILGSKLLKAGMSAQFELGRFAPARQVPFERLYEALESWIPNEDGVSIPIPWS